MDFFDPMGLLEEEEPPPVNIKNKQGRPKKRGRPKKEHNQNTYSPTVNNLPPPPPETSKTYKKKDTTAAKKSYYVKKKDRIPQPEKNQSKATKNKKIKGSKNTVANGSHNKGLTDDEIIAKLQLPPDVIKRARSVFVPISPLTKTLVNLYSTRLSRHTNTPLSFETTPEKVETKVAKVTVNRSLVDNFNLENKSEQSEDVEYEETQDSKEPNEQENEIEEPDETEMDIGEFLLRKQRLLQLELQQKEKQEEEEQRKKKIDAEKETIPVEQPPLVDAEKKDEAIDEQTSEMDLETELLQRHRLLLQELGVIDLVDEDDDAIRTKIAEESEESSEKLASPRGQLPSFPETPTQNIREKSQPIFDDPTIFKPIEIKNHKEKQTERSHPIKNSVDRVTHPPLNGDEKPTKKRKSKKWEDEDFVPPGFKKPRTPLSRKTPVSTPEPRTPLSRKAPSSSGTARKVEVFGDVEETIAANQIDKKKKKLDKKQKKRDKDFRDTRESQTVVENLDSANSFTFDLGLDDDDILYVNPTEFVDPLSLDNFEPLPDITIGPVQVKKSHKPTAKTNSNDLVERLNSNRTSIETYPSSSSNRAKNYKAVIKSASANKKVQSVNNVRTLNEIGEGNSNRESRRRNAAKPPTVSGLLANVSNEVVVYRVQNKKSSNKQSSEPLKPITVSLDSSDEETPVRKLSKTNGNHAKKDTPMIGLSSTSATKQLTVVIYSQTSSSTGSKPINKTDNISASKTNSYSQCLNASHSKTNGGIPNTKIASNTAVKSSSKSVEKTSKKNTLDSSAKQKIRSAPLDLAPENVIYLDEPTDEIDSMEKYLEKRQQLLEKMVKSLGSARKKPDHDHDYIKAID